MKLNFNKTIPQNFESWGRNYELVFDGHCVVCNRNTFQVKELPAGNLFDPDPRGQIPEKHAASSLVASEYNLTGRDIPLCYFCHNERKNYDRAVEIAKSEWVANS